MKDFGRGGKKEKEGRDGDGRGGESGIMSSLRNVMREKFRVKSKEWKRLDGCCV